MAYPLLKAVYRTFVLFEYLGRKFKDITFA